MSLKHSEYSAQTAVCQPVLPGLVDRLIARIAPWRCVLCQAPGADMDLCAACLADLPALSAGCRHCALPLPAAIPVCGRCMHSEQPVDHAVAALAYEYPVDRLITGLKFKKRLCFAPVLAQLLLCRLLDSRIREQTGSPDLLMAVPLHPWRLAERGFNQAEEIARRLAPCFGLQGPAGPVSRIKSTPHQTGLSRSARLRNLQGAFRVRTHVDNLHIVIVDDVITTGATVNILARLLKRAGAARVDVWAVARTP